MTRVCSWCKVVMGTTTDHDPRITHGICETCKVTLLAEVRVSAPAIDKHNMQHVASCHA